MYYSRGDFYENKTILLEWIEAEKECEKCKETKETWAYGTLPTYSGTPSKAPTATVEYVFSGWNTTPVVVKSDATYVAKFTETARKINHRIFFWSDACNRCGNASAVFFPAKSG